MLDTFPSEAKEEIIALKDLVFYLQKKYYQDSEELYRLRLRVKEFEAKEGARRAQDAIDSI
jgi:hypothetical protein